jgi:hypothetical protein
VGTSGNSTDETAGAVVRPIDVGYSWSRDVYIACFTAPVLLLVCGASLALIMRIGVIGALVGLVALPAGLYCTSWLLLRRRGHEAWLAGSVLTVRRVFGLRRFDLASAKIAIGSVPGRGRRRPFLLVHDPNPGHTVRLKLFYGSGLLPPAQLFALADAIAPDHDYTSGTTRYRARQVALRLRELAGDPFAGHL